MGENCCIEAGIEKDLYRKNFMKTIDIQKLYSAGIKDLYGYICENDGYQRFIWIYL